MRENGNGCLQVELVDSDGNAVAALGTISVGTAGAASSDVLSVQGVDGATPVKTRGATGYETVAAGQTAQVLGGAGASGDYLERLVIIPAVAASGAVTLLDGATSISIFVGGGTTALSNLMPVTVQLGVKSASGPWKITTGANVSVIAVGDFSA